MPGEGAGLPSSHLRCHHHDQLAPCEPALAGLVGAVGEDLIVAGN